MKISQFTKLVDIDNRISILYNTFSRQYITLLPEKREMVLKFLGEINKGLYSKEEIEIFSEMTKKKIIVFDEENEVKQIEELENNACHRKDKFQIVIYTTNQCNFRCVYCTQEHIQKNLEKDTIEQIIELIASIAKEVDEIELNWFGGEPLLQYENIVRILKITNEICEQNHCICSSNVVTNGYLLNRKRLEELRKLNVKQMQITVDGNKKLHDKQRILINGRETYDIILNNICMALESGIKVTLRVNVGGKITLDVLDEIPIKYRKDVVVSIANIFQNKNKISTYEMAKQAIRKGYRYQGRYNSCAKCIANQQNSLYIDADGRILLCSNICTDEKAIGKLQKKGKVEYSDKGKKKKLQSVSTVQNEQCRKCIELPLCIGDCKYWRMDQNDRCLGKRPDGMTLEERARIDYYDDEKHKKEAE